MMPRPKTNGNGRLRKLECPTCQMIVYASRGAVIRHGLPTCACGGELYLSDLEDALRATPEHAHLHPDFSAYTERAIRSAMREATNVPAERLRCGGCNAWVGATNARCSCGFLNDIRGNRNYGRWVEGASRARQETPF